MPKIVKMIVPIQGDRNQRSILYFMTNGPFYHGQQVNPKDLLITKDLDSLQDIRI